MYHNSKCRYMYLSNNVKGWHKSQMLSTCKYDANQKSYRIKFITEN